MSSAAYDLVINVYNCVEFVCSLLCWPSALATFVVLTRRCYKNGQLVDALPLLMGQLNTAFIWGCMTVYSIMIFSYQIDGDPLIRGNPVGFRFYSIRIFLAAAI